jgi:hypothetical protein
MNLREDRAMCVIASAWFCAAPRHTFSYQVVGPEGFEPPTKGL